MKSVLGSALALGMTQAAWAQTQGVSDDEIVIGSVNDLSGIFAAIGVPAINGANLKIDEVNEAGGVHGRKIRFVVEDHTYQLPKAAQAYNKLVNRDGVFAMMLSLGTPHNLAGFKIMDPKGIPNLNPLSAAREMLAEPIDNKYTGFASYYDQAIAGIEYLKDEFGYTNVCAMYLPTDFGIEISSAAKESTEDLGTTFVAETTHKPDEQDFVGAVQKLRSENCETIVMALGVRAGITVVGTAKQLGWTEAKFLNTSAGFLEPVAAVPNGVTDGLYAAAGWVDLAARAEDPVPAAFIEAYEEEYGQPAGGFAMLGYNAAETLIMALEAAGPDLTHESFKTAMESVDYYSELLDTQISYGPGDHQGANEITISVVEDGKWKLLARQ
ncbi:ABC transporter substrate-binding protein [Lutimaribacter sp. EGI FJ00015]|uniref:ABC transporter substrate-binding protein n=2 Tax=Lutimaribacter degradans TaxID=2945989 RepID=A0ACC5ZZL5_9RHOB|nr:ABC transporter substrate-binding protein [Lutimaribacter sp. EGI FJ00013]MCM2563270.1 ABC transporter substrate-binding protein [Lutimaribacter sp. EGI FJ00013]MCO0614407.1 ABC transporter substrate-binding protein [Lutimaribacter sp. EGI FJ00015]MCO0635992.1 ABC transporter substrate-binding protein [Lutimaribacter sp. EGI FJ00014]